MSTYTLTSTKGSRDVTGDLHAAIQAALEMEEELQPAYGVTVMLGEQEVAEVRDGSVELAD